MARLSTKTRRKIKIESVLALLAVFVGLAWLSVCLFIGTQKNNLTIEIQDIENQIEVLKYENKNLNVEISGLQNKDRIYTVAETAGMNQNDNNVIALSGE